jgi:hypothetical protein
MVCGDLKPKKLWRTLRVRHSFLGFICKSPAMRGFYKQAGFGFIAKRWITESLS